MDFDQKKKKLKDGRRVHVIERDMREPVRMMGELMQPGGRLLLSKLGLQGLSPLHFHLRHIVV